MAFTQITQADLNSRGATTLPNQPSIGANALKREFDAPAKEIVAPAVNRLIGELEDTASASSLGAVAPTGRTGSTIQALLNDISYDLSVIETGVGPAVEDAHTHSNKALLDTYSQTEADLSDAVAKKHAHSNKDLLDTYTQTEANLADAVSKKHEHSNKSLLDTYTQTEANLADAVSNSHSHSNKSLLDTYTHSNTDIGTAITNNHTHSNKSVLDKFGESSGQPTYDGNPIGGGGTGTVNNAYKNVVVGVNTLTASGEDTITFEAGENVSLSADTSTKTVTITATGGGGGTSTGDMLKSVYDSNNDGVVNSADTLAGLTASIAELNHTDGVTGNIQTQLDGKAASSHTHTVSNITDFPTIPTALADLTADTTHRVVTDTEKSTWNGKQNALTEGTGIDITNNVISVDAATAVTSGETKPITSGAVYTELDTYHYTKTQVDDKIKSMLKFGGVVTAATLPSCSATDVNKYFVVSDAVTTTSDYLLGSGITLPAYSNIAILNTGTDATPVYKYVVLSGYTDLSSYQTKAITTMTIRDTTASTVTDALTALNGELDEWTTESTLSTGDTTKSWTGLSPDCTGYEAWFECKSGQVPPTLTEPLTITTTSSGGVVTAVAVTAKFTAVVSGQSPCKIRLHKVK